MKKHLKVASFFAGVGGIDLGFENAGFKVIWANEMDKYACQTYRANWRSTLLEGDIHKVEAKDIPDFDVMVAGFPCQAFSVAGYRKGFDDDRGNLFFELERIFLRKKPPVIFLENVKNLVGHDKGNTFRVILQHLEDAGYHVKYQVLNAMEYGNLPQNRERIYIVAFLDKRAYHYFEFPNPIERTTKLADLIDFHGRVHERFMYTPEKYTFFDELDKNMTSMDTVYQWRRIYVRRNKNNVCPTLTANMGTGGHNVPLIRSTQGIRKLTPRECFSMMGFPKDYHLPENMATCHLYKQAGNSVTVPVIERIARSIIQALKDTKKKA